jgi:hypothetical protein
MEVNHPCLVLVNHSGNKVTVSDPTASVNEITIIMSNKAGKRKTELVTLPEAQFAGSSVVLK